MKAGRGDGLEFLFEGSFGVPTETVAKAVGMELTEVLEIFISAVWERLKDVRREEAEVGGAICVEACTICKNCTKSMTSAGSTIRR